MTETQTPVFRTLSFVDGDFREALSGQSFATENPATGKVLAEIASCDSPDVDRAVSAARRAFEDGSWSRQSPEDRKSTLMNLSTLLEEHAEELAAARCVGGRQTHQGLPRNRHTRNHQNVSVVRRGRGQAFRCRCSNRAGQPGSHKIAAS